LNGGKIIFIFLMGKAVAKRSLERDPQRFALHNFEQFLRFRTPMYGECLK
jgi:hypothetical protein